MLITLSVPVIIILDIFGWFVIQMGMAYLFTRLPEQYFNTDNFLFRSRKWERSATFYDHTFSVKRWKGFLPDGAALFAGGFRKKQLVATDIKYYQRFNIETCRGEATHWAVILCTPVFFIWNYWWANIVMIIYSLAANFPCILTQRYNRLRLRNVLNKRLDHRVKSQS